MRNNKAREGVVKKGEMILLNSFEKRSKSPSVFLTIILGSSKMDPFGAGLRPTYCLNDRIRNIQEPFKQISCNSTFF